MKGNFIINDKTSNFMKLSLSAYYKLDTITLGVYCKLLGLGENWEMIPKALPSVLNLSKDKTIASIKTLEREGFLQRVAAKDVHGKFVGYIYRLNAEPAPAEERTRAGLGYVNSGLPENGVVQKPSTPKTGNPENPLPNNIENNNKYKDFNKNNKDNNKDYSSSTTAREEEEFVLDEKAFVQMFNKYVDATNSKIKRLHGLDKERMDKVKYLVEKYGVQEFGEFLCKAMTSKFLNADGNEKWATFDWLINENNFLKVVEDNYKELYNDNKPNNDGRTNNGLAGEAPQTNAERAGEWATNRIKEIVEKSKRKNQGGVHGELPDGGSNDRFLLPF